MVETQSYKVKLDIFEGPLDLLLFLIKQDEIDIYEISIERITQQYLSYLETFQVLNINLAGEFIVMAANLIYIKSRSMLPRPLQPPEDDAEDDDPRWELIRQLIEYKKFKDAAHFLEQKAEEQECLFPNHIDRPSKPEDAPPPLAEASTFDLIRAFQKVLNRLEEQEERTGEIVDDRWTVGEKITHLLDHLPLGKPTSFAQLMKQVTSKGEVIVTFLAILELMKVSQLRAIQSSHLGDIELLRSEEENPAPSE